MNVLIIISGRPFEILTIDLGRNEILEQLSARELTILKNLALLSYESFLFLGRLIASLRSGPNSRNLRTVYVAFGNMKHFLVLYGISYVPALSVPLPASYCLLRALLVSRPKVFPS